MQRKEAHAIAFAAWSAIKFLRTCQFDARARIITEMSMQRRGNDITMVRAASSATGMMRPGEFDARARSSVAPGATPAASSWLADGRASQSVRSLPPAPRLLRGALQISHLVSAGAGGVRRMSGRSSRTFFASPGK
jgi:hypothetical protein